MPLITSSLRCIDLTAPRPYPADHTSAPTEPDRYRAKDNGVMPNLLSRTMLFLNSYAPLFRILAIRNWSTQYVARTLVAITLGSVLWLLLFIRHARSQLAAVSIDSRGRPREMVTS